MFVPLCGRSVDLVWVRSRGCRVVGVELAETAVEAFFDAFGVSPEVSEGGALTRYSAEDVDLFAGDFFDLPGARLGPVEAVYDRAALVALPPTGAPATRRTCSKPRMRPRSCS